MNHADSHAEVTPRSVRMFWASPVLINTWFENNRSTMPLKGKAWLIYEKLEASGLSLFFFFFFSCRETRSNLNNFASLQVADRKSPAMLHLYHLSRMLNCNLHILHWSKLGATGPRPRKHLEVNRRTRTPNSVLSSSSLGSIGSRGIIRPSSRLKGAPAIECQTYTRLVSPAEGPKKKNGGLDNSTPRSL